MHDKIINLIRSSDNVQNEIESNSNDDISIDSVQDIDDSVQDERLISVNNTRRNFCIVKIKRILKMFQDAAAYRIVQLITNFAFDFGIKMYEKYC